MFINSICQEKNLYLKIIEENLISVNCNKIFIILIKNLRIEKKIFISVFYIIK